MLATNASKLMMSINETEDRYILYLQGIFDLKSIQYFHSITEPLATDASKQLCFDLKELQYIDSSGLGAFVSVLKMRQHLGTHLEMINIPTKVQRLLNLTGIAKFLKTTV